MEQRLAAIPDPLAAGDGGTVSSADMWRERRRPEVLELFRAHVYGREPLQRPEALRFEVLSVQPAFQGKAERKEIAISYGGPGGEGTINLHLYVPVNLSSPSPVFVLMNIGGSKRLDADTLAGTPFWPAESIVARGYATAVFQAEDIDPDYDDGFRNGVHGLFDPAGEPRAADAWGTIAAWAWGAGRVMDYIEHDPQLDAGRTALVGHSRGGKAALWAGAMDERFAMVVSNNSGCTGAAVSRGKIGESIRDINTQFPHWFADTYKRYNDRENELPVDQHMLLSLIAPRLLYVTSASEDSWADPESEFLGLKLAEPVYALFGHEGLEAKTMPAADRPIRSAGTGYHLRTGGHDLTAFDWACFLDFADARLI